MFNSDTIAAIATGLTDSGISIIRISGEDAFQIADKVVILPSSEKISDQKSHTINYGHIYYNNEIIDEVLVSVFRGPRSYTAEDTIEINCHGGLLITKKVLEIVLASGARIAEPGEFTKRAFLNGRIDLTKAEAVVEKYESHE